MSAVHHRRGGASLRSAFMFLSMGLYPKHRPGGMRDAIESGHPSVGRVKTGTRLATFLQQTVVYKGARRIPPGRAYPVDLTASWRPFSPQLRPSCLQVASKMAPRRQPDGMFGQVASELLPRWRQEASRLQLDPNLGQLGAVLDALEGPKP